MCCVLGTGPGSGWGGAQKEEPYRIALLFWAWGWSRGDFDGGKEQLKQHSGGSLDGGDVGPVEGRSTF